VISEIIKVAILGFGLYKICNVTETGRG